MLGHLVAQGSRINRGEPEPDGAAPSFGNFEHLYVNSLVWQDDAIAEHERLAEALRPSGNALVLAQQHIGAVNVVKLDRRQVVLDCVEDGV
mgnify:CR=1 FL=1